MSHQVAPDPLEADFRRCVAQRDLLARYPGQVVVFHNRVILGCGADCHEATKDVRQRADQDNRVVPSEVLPSTS